MLEPGRRCLFLDTLRPPPGYDFDSAVGTTFTLNLEALLAVPLAFTFSDAEDGRGRLAQDPLALLEAARRHAGRIVLFCHGGYAAVPRPGQAALSFLEESLVTAFPPEGNREGGVFHPKLWVLRYRAEGEPVRYRVVCQSRNLTFDRSWDATVTLDGVFRDDRVYGYSVNRPLADFVGALPGMAASPIGDRQRRIIDQLAEEIRRVEFNAPAGLKLERFLGFGNLRQNPEFPGPPERPLVVISPFLGGSFLRELGARTGRTVLISRREDLLSSPRELIERIDAVYAFRDGLDPEPEDLDSSLPPLGGLHAKIYVAEEGKNAHIAVGSANAAESAVGPRPRNVEFMVELVGPSSQFGIRALLDPPDNPSGAGSFIGLIAPFDKSEAGTVKPDEDPVEGSLASAAAAVARADICGELETDGELFDLRLTVPDPIDLGQEVGSITCWPATLPAAAARELCDGVLFEGLQIQDLIGFLAIEITSANNASKRQRFVRPIVLDGLPEDRLPRLYSSMLSNRASFLRLLRLLLTPDSQISFGGFKRESENETGDGSSWSLSTGGMLERMLETLATRPQRLDAVDRLLRDLRATESGRKIVGAEFEAAWTSLMAVRRDLG